MSADISLIKADDKTKMAPVSSASGLMLEMNRSFVVIVHIIYRDDAPLKATAP